MYKNSLKIFKIINYIKSFWLGSMISVLFLKFVGLKDVDIGVFHFILGLLIFFLEIPTGRLADKYGYKNSINLSFLFLSLAFLSFLTSIIFGKYIIFLFTASFFSLSSSFSSGASNSYIYTIFRYEKREKEYINFKSEILKFGRIIEGIAILIGAYLYSYEEYLPYMIQFFLVFGAFILSLFLKKEPTHKKQDLIEGKIKNVLKIFFSKKTFIYLLIFSLFTTIPHEYFHHVINQSIFVEKGMTVKQIGLIGVFSYIISGLLIHFIPTIWNNFGIFYSYLFMIILTPLVGLSFLFAKNLILITLITSFLYFINGAKVIFTDNFIQSKIKEDHLRATLISIFSMLSNLPTKLMFILFGISFIGVSYSQTMAILSSTFGIIALIFLLTFLKKEFKK